MKLAISTPYRANSILHIAKGAEERGVLELFFTTLYLSRWQNIASKLPLVGLRLGREIGRRAFFGIPANRVVSVAVPNEIVHVFARRFFTQINPSTVANLMYRVKESFDIEVAGRLIEKPPDVIVGMYASCLKSFREMHRQGGMNVLNFVNSHPAVHNQFLTQIAGLKAPHHELIPDWVCKRVENEIVLADVILVPSHFVAQQLIKRGVHTEKIVILPYGVDFQAFCPPSELRQDNQTGLECLYVGQISHRKGIRILLETARKCKNLPVTFRLIGPLVSKELLNDLPGNVIYQGQSLPQNVAEAMRNADFFIFPTIEDAFALVVFEAMASGLPVITTINSGVSELIHDGVDGFVVSAGNSKQLSEVVHLLVERKELRYRIREEARRKVKGMHSWASYRKSVISKIENFYNNKTLIDTE